MIEDAYLHLLIDEEIFVFEEERVRASTQKEFHQLVVLCEKLNPEEQDSLKRILQSQNFDLSNAKLIQGEWEDDMSFQKMISFGRVELVASLINEQPEENKVYTTQQGGSIFFTKPIKELVKLAKEEKYAFFGPFKEWFAGVSS